MRCSPEALPFVPTHNRHTKANVRSLEESHCHGTIPQFLLRGPCDWHNPSAVAPRRFQSPAPRCAPIRPAAPDGVAPLRTNTLKLLSACVSLKNYRFSSNNHKSTIHPGLLSTLPPFR